MNRKLAFQHSLVVCIGILAGAAALSTALGATARAAEIVPFRTINMSPLALIHPAPAAGSARLLAPRETEVTLIADAANNFAVDSTANESVHLDGETYRVALDLRYGVTPWFEAGIQVPFIGTSGGALDSFVEGFHKVFDFNNGDRDKYPQDELLFSYHRDGTERLHYDDGGFGIGDVRLNAAVRLHEGTGESRTSLALRGSLKLPTGESGRLRGSGGTDFALWLTGSTDLPVGEWGHLTFFGAGGGMVMGDGDVLADQQRNAAGFGTLGFGWSPASWIALKVQGDWHSAFYRASGLRELRTDTITITSGGTIAFSDRTALDIGVVEDASVKTAPDVVFHLALSHRF
ncbi:MULTISPECIES: DUF3187 family protein [Geobacter]|uniref:DUF3187 family protein n=2 Tax=Geobacter TaxID=28231 RepID=A0A0C1TVP3_9BACT|nr:MULTISPECIES: DUF3187 family protein [Geobacter]ANA41296.1 hypothetical protein A2G06_14755 [Geobacter anodireducens]KIE43453.1 hypothetical protein SE37_12840 [Geobacter soli]MBE2888720.1 DUF3187 family protein [Geobacter anodireducens]HMN03526.1 DUF3187 family protein [Geobacter anodireducens]